MATVNQLL